MAKEEVIRFNRDLIKFQKIVLGLKEAGSDTNKIVALANEFGFDFTVDDVKEVAEKNQPEQTGGEQTRALVGAIVIV